MSAEPDVTVLVARLRMFAIGCRGSMWQSRDETIRLCDEAADLIEALRTPPAPTEAVAWRDIATAPRDGTWVALAGGKPGYGWDGDAATTPPIVSASYRSAAGLLGDYWQFAHYDSGYYGEWENPTHWQPLPPPPSADSLGGDVAKRSEPDALPGDMRERVAAVLYENIGAAAWSGDAEVHGIPEAADAILSLIQSERGGA